MQRKLERWLATYLYLYETRFKDIKGNIPYCALGNRNAWYLLIEYNQLKLIHTGNVWWPTSTTIFVSVQKKVKPYLHAQHIFGCNHVLEDDCGSQDAMRVQRKLLLFISSEDGEGKRGAIVKRVFVCHYQLQNACAHWFIFLYTYTQRIKKRIKIIHITIIKYRTLLSRIFNWMLFAQDDISQAVFIWHCLHPWTSPRTSGRDGGVHLIPAQTYWGRAQLLVQQGSMVKCVTDAEVKEPHQTETYWRVKTDMFILSFK